MRFVEVGGRQVEVHVRRSKRVKGNRIVVRFGLAPELVVRPRASDADIDAALAHYLPWLERQLANASEPKLALEKLNITEAQGRREARARIELLAQSEALALGVRYKRLSIRDQVSRWGSCSSAGSLSFNWRLVLAPHDVLDYVVVHEVCHLVEHNHGAAFWALVAKRRPEYRDSKDWLDMHGWEILAYRPPLEVAA
ncbi:MAG TPA: M48 family metallopeptidase [Gaiellaceae bacterium]|nr:M48 family metallopeptidase [Gaiellaceae bacterium]